MLEPVSRELLLESALISLPSLLVWMGTAAPDLDVHDLRKGQPKAIWASLWQDASTCHKSADFSFLQLCGAPGTSRTLCGIKAKCLEDRKQVCWRWRQRKLSLSILLPLEECKQALHINGGSSTFGKADQCTWFAQCWNQIWFYSGCFLSQVLPEYPGIVPLIHALFKDNENDSLSHECSIK